MTWICTRGTYSTVLRTSGEVHLRAFERAHVNVSPSLHPGAGQPAPDTGALIYAANRLPAVVSQVQRVILGQLPEHFSQAMGVRIEDWTPVQAPWRSTSPASRTSTTSSRRWWRIRSSGTSCTPSCAAVPTWTMLRETLTWANACACTSASTRTIGCGCNARLPRRSCPPLNAWHGKKRISPFAYWAAATSVTPS